MKPSRDPVDQALELLRSDDHLELPPPFRPRAESPSRARSRLLPTLVVALGLTAAAAAAGGLGALRTWWFSITVDGRQLQGLAQGDGGVLDAVVLVNVQVAVAAEREVHAAVAGNLVQHVVVEPEAGVDGGASASVQVHLHHDVRFGGGAAHESGAVRGGLRW